MVRERMVTDGFAGASLVVAAAAAIAGVVAWRIVGTGVRADVQTICAAESRSGWTLRREMPALTEWIRGHLTTPEGNVLFASLGDLPVADRGARLRAEAGARGIDACPMASAYETLAAEGDDRADLQRLCSYVTFPDLGARDDAARLEALEAWLEQDASTARTRALAAPLRETQTPAERANVLRTASEAFDILSCDVAKLLESPPSIPDAGAGAAD